MDKITDRISEISNSIKERLSNPFIFSFILSWLLWNWKISVGLLWYDYYQLKVDGYDTYFKLISTEVGKDGSFSCPFWISIGITLLAPILKTIFSLFNAAVITVGNMGYFGITKKGNISTEKYLSLRNKWIELHKELEDVIKSEKDFQSRFLESESNVRRLTPFEQIAAKITDSSFLDGRWELTHTAKDRGQKYIFRFTSGSVTSNPKGNQSDMISWNLGFFFRDTSSRERMVFQIIDSVNGGSQIYSLLKESEETYTGMEISGNNISQVGFIRIEN